MNACTHRGQKRGLDSLELVVVSCLIQVLETQLGPSGSTANSLKRGAFSPALYFLLYFILRPGLITFPWPCSHYVAALCHHLCTVSPSVLQSLWRVWLALIFPPSTSWTSLSGGRPCCGRCLGYIGVWSSFPGPQAVTLHYNSNVSRYCHTSNGRQTCPLLGA